MPSNVSKRSFSLVAILGVGLLPLCWLLCLALFIGRARLFLGYWPSLYHPDPKGLPFTHHYDLLFFGIYLVLGSVFVLPILRFLSPKWISAPLWRQVFQTYFLGWLLILPTVFIPPINFTAWFLD